MSKYPFSSFYTINKNLNSISNIDVNIIPDNPFLMDDIYSLTGAMLYEIYHRKDYEKDFCSIVEGDIVVDIGANIGLFNLYAIDRGASLVYSFEPDNDNFDCLVKNTDKKSILYKGVVSKDTEKKKLYQDKNNIGGHSTYNYFSADKFIEVDSYNLNDLMDNNTIKYINFLKIDAEGSEYDIINSLSDKNLKNIDKIVIEYHRSILGNKPLSNIILKLNKYFNYKILNNELFLVYFWKKTFDQVLGHTSFIPHTGYAYHARDFFTRLNKHIPTRIRNFAHTPDLSHLTQEQKDMVIEQKWIDPPYSIGKPYVKSNKPLLNIVLMESNHYYFYDEYKGPKIAYNVWESTRQQEHFFKKLLEFDQLWVPTEWQKKVSIEQGYPEDKIKVVHEGVDFDTFNVTPTIDKPNEYKDGRFKFLIFGRWDHRKATTEMIKAFLDEFKPDEPIDLLISVDNPFAVDKMSNTKERLEYYGLKDERIRDIGFVSREDYIKYLKNGHVFLSCSRAEGWNLPLGEAIACGIPTICSSHGAQLEFAEGISYKVKTKEYKKPENVFMANDVPGEWDEPDFDDLRKVMRYVYENYEKCKESALIGAEKIKENFKWSDAVNTAQKYIAELYNKIYPTEIKVNVGCGEFKLDGYINVDLIDGLGDIQMDVLKLTFDGLSLDVINSSHVLEHFGKIDVINALNEWYRVLKYGGKLILEVPDLKWCLNNWLNNVDDKWALDTIFGDQHNEYEFHKTGFTKEKIISLLKETGFYIGKFEEVFSHGQNCFKIECIKRDINFDDDIFIISTYPDEEYKLDILRNTISIFKQYNKPIAISTHHPLPEDIIKDIDYLIYDKSNPLSENWNLNEWMATKNLKIITKYENKYHAVTVLTNIVNSINCLSNIYNYAHFIEYDIDLDLDRYLNICGKQRIKDKKLICFRYDIEQKHPSESEKGVITNCLSFDLKYWQNIFSKYKIRNWKEYVELDGIMSGKFNQPEDYIFENWFYTFMKYNNIVKDSYIIPHNIKSEILFKRSIIDQGKKESDIRIKLSETADNKVVVFICNFKNENSFKFNIKHIINNDIVDSSIDIIKYEDIKYIVFEKIGTIVVDIEDLDIKKIYDLTDNNLLSETTFKFRDDELICKNWSDEDDFGKKNKILYTFNDKPKVEILGPENNEYNVKFIDNDTKLTIHEGNIRNNNWISCNRRYYTNWKIIVENIVTHEIEEYIFDPTKRDIYIIIDSKSIGDTIAWFPYIEEFRKKHNCNVTVSTFYNKFFEKNYPNLTFENLGSVTKEFYATYYIGCRDNDYSSNKNNWRTIPLQQTSSDYLGLDYKEIKPFIVKVNKERPIKEKYVCISEHSTFQCKYWNNPDGWQTLIYYLNSIGYKVMVISKEATKLKNIINKTNKSIEETINNLQHCEFFIGISSGPAWLAWGLDKPVVMISGCTDKMHEMKDCLRIYNDTVCYGCFNKLDIVFDRGNWNLCPYNKNFICTREINAEQVISSMQKLLNI